MNQTTKQNAISCLSCVVPLNFKGTAQEDLKQLSGYKAPATQLFLLLSKNSI